MAPIISDGVGSRDLGRLFRLLREEVIPPGDYVLFRDMITHAADESAPLQHTQWRIWKGLGAGFRLFEIAPIQDLARLIAWLDSRWIRVPGRQGGIPYTEFTSADWELGIPEVILTM